jgi:hypothetical protein
MDGKLCKPQEDEELVEIETEPIELQDADSNLDAIDTAIEELSTEEEVEVEAVTEEEEEPDPEPNEGVPKTEPLTDLNSLFN